METRQHSRQIQFAAFVVIGFTLYRIFHAGTFLLVPDETNYWQWGRHLDWGYHDQAPMIGWLIRLFCELMGHTERAVRMPSLLGTAVASIYMVLTARRWFGDAAALGTAILTQTVLLFNVGGLLATADGIQAAGWAGATYHIARGYEENGWDQWLAGGFWFGFGMLSKFTMVLFALFAFFYGITSATHRNRLAGPKPWVAMLFGSLLFFPVLYWNHIHDWNSVRHVAHLGGANESAPFTLKYFFEYIGSEAALLTPVVWILVIMGWYAAFRKDAPGKPWIRTYLFATSCPMILFFAVLSLHTRIYGNWPAAGYLGASVLAAAFFAPGAAPGIPFYQKGRKLWPWAVATTTLLSALVMIQAAWPILPIPVEWDRSARETAGWDRVGEKALALKNAMPEPSDTFLFGIRYQFASELAFYVPGQPDTVSINKWKRPNVYDYWWEDHDLLGQDAIGLSRSANMQARLSEVFARVEPPVPFPVMRKNEHVRDLYFYRCHDFKGGLRWQPRNQGDVRATQSVSQ